MNKTALNINNLTNLWTVAGEVFQGYSEHNGVYCSHIKNTQWPNRLWTDTPLSAGLKHQLKGSMEKIPGLTFSYFNNGHTSPFQTDPDFMLKSKQYGMSMELTEKFGSKKIFDFRTVTNREEAELWSKAFHLAFNYNISVETVLNTMNTIPYILVSEEEVLVGTVILHITEQVAGIHSLGIVPSQRKKGYATEIMYHIMNEAIDSDSKLATLQASEMARAMYEKMGFTTDFLMENYTLKNEL
ncbi:GNAT family N-acetyltransferase [Zhouia amylolytica]|uniref:N-acetyltransferase domain-containing protein n=1 Tax=Zhouia amylolytica AD3 TaxID=1286632 RepID=W2UPR7_9FLAO|nr:GNAT family N-acetyltransferase [Zhouia amylolytica]ETN95486.1 hypothetical protein P278_12080 [Zhouia amylolytica AD3]